MEPPTNQQIIIIEDKDANCRLRHDLNVHCLAQIFKYLDSVDLYTLGGMNAFYKQIINDSVISRHTVTLIELEKHHKITALQFFERYGTNIRKFMFENAVNGPFDEFLQIIAKFCSHDQLRDVQIKFSIPHNKERAQVDLSTHFRKLETFIFQSKVEMCIVPPVQLSVSLSESLHHLRLINVILNPNFDWTELKNLSEIFLLDVNGITVENFIKFLRQRPNIKKFYHCKTFENSTQDIHEALAEYCGDRIHVFQFDHDCIANANLNYNFISGLKMVKKVSLSAYEICGGDLMNPLRRLADNNTIEELDLHFECERWHNDENCIWKDHARELNMKHFSKLKTLRIHLDLFRAYVRVDDHSGQKYGLMTQIAVHSTQILSNVENIIFYNACREDFHFIQFALKIRQLDLGFSPGLTSDDATEIVSKLENILKNRNSGTIKIVFQAAEQFALFAEICGRRNSSIQLSQIKDKCTEEHWKCLN